MIYTLLGKMTLILLAALGLDGLFHRKWLLLTAAMWNAVLLAVVVLPTAALLIPQWVLPLMPRQNSAPNWPNGARDPSNVEQSTTSNTHVGPNKYLAGPADVQNLPIPTPRIGRQSTTTARRPFQAPKHGMLP